MKIGVHFIARRLLTRADANNGQVRHASVFRCADGFTAMAGRAVNGTEFIVWDEEESAESFVRRVDVLVGIPDIRLLRARERVPIPPPYLMLVMGNATRAIPFARPVMEMLRREDTLVTSCAADIGVLELFLEAPTADSISRAPMPSDLSRFIPTSASPPLAQRLSEIAPERPIILSAERFNRGKGVHRALPMVEHLRNEGHQPVLVFLGAESDPAGRAYQQQVDDDLRKRGLADSTVFLPFLDTTALAGVYARANVALSVSTIYDNNFGYVPIEALAAGTPSIATDWGGYRDVVIDGVTGVRIPTTLRRDGTVDIDLAATIPTVSALLTDDARYEAMVTAGQHHLEDSFSVAASQRIYSELALMACDRVPSDLQPWRSTELAKIAVRSRWVAQTDNADRTARILRGTHVPGTDYFRIRQAIYSHYATNTEDES